VFYTVFNSSPYPLIPVLGANLPDLVLDAASDRYTGRTKSILQNSISPRSKAAWVWGNDCLHQLNNHIVLHCVTSTQWLIVDQRALVYAQSFLEHVDNLPNRNIPNASYTKTWCWAPREVIIRQLMRGQPQSIILLHRAHRRRVVQQVPNTNIHIIDLHPFLFDKPPLKYTPHHRFLSSHPQPLPIFSCHDFYTSLFLLYLFFLLCHHRVTMLYGRLLPWFLLLSFLLHLPLFFLLLHISPPCVRKHGRLANQRLANTSLFIVGRNTKDRFYRSSTAKIPNYRPSSSPIVHRPLPSSILCRIYVGIL